MPEVVPILASDRERLAKLVSERVPADAVAAYYALNHAAARVRLFGLQTVHGDLTAFAVAAQTGQDLFRPLLIPVASTPEGLNTLLHAALRPGVPVLLHLPIDQRAWLAEFILIEAPRRIDLYRSEAGSLPNEINVLVVPTTNPEGLSRFEIRSPQGVAASAGLNWKGPVFAEVYVEGNGAARSRGWTRSVLAAATADALRDHRIPLLFVAESDAAGQVEAEWAGYRRTGDRYLLAHTIRRDEPPTVNL